MTTTIDVNSLEAIIEDLFTKDLNNGVLDSRAIMHTTLIIMESVEQYKDMPGPKKKELVISLINSVLEKILPDELKEKIITLVRETLPDIIDIIAVACKGKFKINTFNIKKKISKCCFPIRSHK